jgi:hypothetical protein
MDDREGSLGNDRGTPPSPGGASVGSPTVIVPTAGTIVARTISLPRMAAANRLEPRRQTGTPCSTPGIRTPFMFSTSSRRAGDLTGSPGQEEGDGVRLGAVYRAVEDVPVRGMTWQVDQPVGTVVDPGLLPQNPPHHRVRHRAGVRKSHPPTCRRQSSITGSTAMARGRRVLPHRRTPRATVRLRPSGGRVVAWMNPRTSQVPA